MLSGLNETANHTFWVLGASLNQGVRGPQIVFVLGWLMFSGNCFELS